MTHPHDERRARADALGDRMKLYESIETDRRVMPGLPIYARIDGRSFSNFTKGMDRPCDMRMSDCMIATMCRLISETHAKIGYTQSDEISLCWHPTNEQSEPLFGAKVQKTASVLAGLATAVFNFEIRGRMPEYADRLPHFDARVVGMPSRTEIANMFLWRNLDATKNAISMAARSLYSHNQLHGKSSAEMQEMLFAKGVNFNDCPAFFKRGTWARRALVTRSLTEDEWHAIPERNRPPREHLFERSAVESFDLPKFSSVLNREAVIFDGERAMLDACAEEEAPSGD